MTDVRKGGGYKSCPLFYLLVLWLLCFGCETHVAKNPDGSPTVGRHVGQIAPDFTLPARDGSQVSLKALRGKVVVLNFWATWCPPCRDEMPTMEKLTQQMKGKDFMLLAVSIDEEGWGVIDPFVQAAKLSFPILWDQNAKVTKQYGSYRFPETFILNREGIILDKKVGAFDWASAEHLKYFNDLTQPK